ncbi:MAG TPA: hypothetical protein VFE16_13075 [Candidatus Cybelea sp.]|nr:hypothetical protein [Candidatus Cybelea sp.]
MVFIVGSGCSAQNAPGVPAGAAARTRGVAPLTTAQAASAERAIRQRSRVNPAARKGRLLYVADPGAGAVLIYTYPQLSGAGTLSGFGSVDGVCTDRQGYVWVLDTSDVVAWEFAHGGTEPINYLQPGDSNGNPGVGSGCVVSTITGDLAVAGAGPGFTVFRNGQSTHATYWDYNFFQTDYIGYDGSGNLFVDGITESTLHFAFAELPAGSSNVEDVTLSGGTIQSPGGIAWDGKHLDIGDGATGTIYQTNGASILGSVTTAATCGGQFYIPNGHKRVIMPDPCSVQTGIFGYPAGGPAQKSASGGQVLPRGAAISVPSE